MKRLAVGLLLALVFVILRPGWFGEPVAPGGGAVVAPPAALAAPAGAAQPSAPRLEDLPLQDSVAQYDITWKFDKKVRVGRFITGDYYVVGMVTVVEIDPKFENDRNGSMLNPATGSEQGYGKVAGGFAASLVYNPALVNKPPIAMKPGDSLVSTITYESGDGSARPYLEGYGTSGAVSKTAAVLTCLEQPVPADTFRPSYCGHQSKLYRYSDLHTELLLKLQPTASAPPLAKYERLLGRPWLDHVYGWGTREIHPSGNMPDYGQSVGRVMSEAALLLSCDYPLENKKKLLIGVVQYGIDLWGCIERGCKGWPQQGGFGAGRKWPILFAGVLFNDEAMQHPKAEFAEDEGHDFDHCWSGANVVFNGHSGKNGMGDPGRAMYEHLHPSLWLTTTSETYRRNSTSSCYPGFALVARLMHLEKVWDHDAFFAYIDRWMGENDAKFYDEMISVFKLRDWPISYWDHQGHSTEKFVNEMWAKYRFSPGLPPSGYKPIPTAEQGNVQIGPSHALLVDGKPFLPLMLVSEGPGEIESAKSLGINTFLGNGWTSDKLGFARSKDFLERLAAAGMYGVFGPDARLCGQPNLLGWLQYNQPDAIKIQPVPDIALDAAHKPDRGFPLARLVDGVTKAQCLISPMAGAEITIKLKEPVTAYSFALWTEAGTPEDPKDLVFLVDGKEVLKGTKADKSGQQKFPLPQPVTFHALTLKVVSVYETDQRNKWGSIDEIQALDKDDKPLPLYVAHLVPAVPAECTGELYQWFKRMDTSRPVFVDLAMFGVQGSKGWSGDVRKTMYGELLKQCEVPGLETGEIAQAGDVAAAVAELRAMAAPGQPVFATIDLGAKGVGPQDVRARVWAAIIVGASAIGYRVPSSALGPEMKTELARLNAQLTKLAPAILAAPARMPVGMTLTGNARGHVKATLSDGLVTVFAQSLGQAAARATFTVAGLRAGAKVEVVDESRTLDAQDGSFADDFAPLAEHIYKITK